MCKWHWNSLPMKDSLVCLVTELGTAITVWSWYPSLLQGEASCLWGGRLSSFDSILWRTKDTDFDEIQFIHFPPWLVIILASHLKVLQDYENLLLCFKAFAVYLCSCPIWLQCCEWCEEDFHAHSFTWCSQMRIPPAERQCSHTMWSSWKAALPYWVVLMSLVISSPLWAVGFFFTFVCTGICGFI